MGGDGLAHANRVRQERARLKRVIAAGGIGEVLADPPPEAQGWGLGEVLIAQRQWGPVRVERLLARVGISEQRPLGCLTARERALLAQMLNWQDT
jgi:hypothetical protein